ncbi:uncharacterized protein LOC143253720 isoform X2 [Tachypleus tridentatus]|uniref:uncharacterized protein LOC143253720 isoform X2 n=1 Tax=Tachypleus tridentatus TaxID=6853 RepID=UPI003FD1D07A
MKYELGIMIYSMRTSQSPMEMLVMLYIHCIKLYGNGSWETAKPLVIGVHGACISFFNVVKEELLQIIDLFVAFGAEVELRHTLQFPMLHYLVQQYPDVELISRLCENGANIQKEDHHGNTILHILVQMKINDTDRFLKTSHVELMQYLLHHPNIKVDAQNCQGHSPLWLAFATGHFDRAQMLLECGADSVKLHRGIISFPHSPWVFSIPSLLAAVVRSSQLLTPEEDGGVNSPIDPSFNVLKHRLKETTLIIDKGFFHPRTAEIEESISSFVQNSRTLCVHHSLLEKLKGKRVIMTSLFGQLSLTLQQTCIRKIFYICLTHLLNGAMKTQVVPGSNNSISVASTVNCSVVLDVPNNFSCSGAVNRPISTSVSVCCPVVPDVANTVVTSDILPCFRSSLTVGELEHACNTGKLSDIIQYHESSLPADETKSDVKSSVASDNVHLLKNTPSTDEIEHEPSSRINQKSVPTLYNLVSSRRKCLDDLSNPFVKEILSYQNEDVRKEFYLGYFVPEDAGTSSGLFSDDQIQGGLRNIETKVNKTCMEESVHPINVSFSEGILIPQELENERVQLLSKPDQCCYGQHETLRKRINAGANNKKIGKEAEIFMEALFNTEGRFHFKNYKGDCYEDGCNFTSRLLQLNMLDLEKLMENLNLPQPFINLLELELFRLKFFLVLSDGNFGDVSCSCSDADSSSSVESDISDNEFSDSEGHNGDNQSSSSDEEYFETHF